MLKTLKLLWSIKAVKKGLVEGSIRESQILFLYLTMLVMGWAVLINMNSLILNNLGMLVALISNPIICFLIHKNYNMKNFQDKYISISCVTSIRIIIYMGLLGILLGIAIALTKNLQLISLLEDFNNGKGIVYLISEIISILYTVWHYYGLACQYKNQVSI